MKRYLLLLTFVLLAMSVLAQSQERTITGTVTDASNKQGIPGAAVFVKSTQMGVLADKQGKYTIQVPAGKEKVIFSHIGYIPVEIKIKDKIKIDVKLQPDTTALEEEVVTGYGTQKNKKHTVGVQMNSPSIVIRGTSTFRPDYNTEEYDAIHDNSFLNAKKNPLSTFSIDVDNAAYSNVRRFLTMGQLPPKDAVRSEELLNYFTYDYPQPKDNKPFSITTELSTCPWNSKNQLLHIGIQGKEVPTDQLPASNLVFLIDVSGSMMSANKLPLVKTGFKMLVEQLRPQDKVAIVVYAGAAGTVLEPTTGSQKGKIIAAIENLQAGGATAGSEGILKAYELAQENFLKGGNNRVILATDGDFNVGVSSNAELERIVEEKRKSGVFLTVLGFGMGNLKDSKMETLADKGNGNYSYVDNALEAKKVFVNEFGGTLFTIAKDVKLQLEFNPAKVKSYRLIGYENRLLAHDDFNNDQKDAGDLGAGHTVTALYEIVPVSAPSVASAGQVDDLKYQQVVLNPTAATSSDLLTLKLRYKDPESETSQLIQTTVPTTGVNPSNTSDNFRFSAAVAGFGMLLRNSEFKGTLTYEDVLKLAEGARGKDKEGYRVEFINLVKTASLLKDDRRVSVWLIDEK